MLDATGSPGKRATYTNVWDLFEAHGHKLEKLEGITGRLGSYKFRTFTLQYAKAVDGEVHFPNDRIPDEVPLQVEILRAAIGAEVWDAVAERLAPKPIAPPKQGRRPRARPKSPHK